MDTILTWRIVAEKNGIGEVRAKQAMFEQATAIRAELASSAQKVPCCTYFACSSTTNVTPWQYRTKKYELSRLLAEPWPPIEWLKENFPAAEGFEMDNVFVESLVRGDDTSRRAILARETEFFEKLFAAAAAEGRLFVPKANSLILGRLEARVFRPATERPPASAPVVGPQSTSLVQSLSAAVVKSQPSSAKPSATSTPAFHPVFKKQPGNSKPLASWVSPQSALPTATSPVSEKSAPPPPSKVRRTETSPPTSMGLSPGMGSRLARRVDTDSAAMATLLFPEQENEIEGANGEGRAPTGGLHSPLSPNNNRLRTMQSHTKPSSNEEEFTVEDGGLVFAKTVPAEFEPVQNSLAGPDKGTASSTSKSGPVQIGLGYFFKPKK